MRFTNSLNNSKIILVVLHENIQPVECYCFLRNASSALPVAQKVVMRQERQLATFCATVTLSFWLQQYMFLCATIAYLSNTNTNKVTEYFIQ